MDKESKRSETLQDEKPASTAHRHRGKTSERFLNKDIILKELDILPGQTILDAGCGNGYMAKEFSKILNNKGKVYALDPDMEAIETLKQETKGTNIEPIEADITQTMPIEGLSIDLIYLSTVLHGFSEDHTHGDCWQDVLTKQALSAGTHSPVKCLMQMFKRAWY